MRYLSIVIYISVLLPAAVFADFAAENQFGIGLAETAAWGDADGDGYLDFAVGVWNVQNHLYVNNGDGTFTENDRFGTGMTTALTWGDVDNDGDLDLAAGNWSQQNYLYSNNGDGTFVQTNQFGTGYTSPVSWGDADNDGDLDLAVGNDGLNYLYVNDGVGGFTQEYQFGTGNTQAMAWGDCDNDGDPDLAVANYNNGQNYLFVNDGSGVFTPESVFGTGDTLAVSWGDYDNDGDLDLAVGNNGTNYLYENKGDRNFVSEVQFGAGKTPSLAWGDYDNDGDLDVAEGNEGQNYLYTNNGDGTFTAEACFGSGYTVPATWGDYDNDGDLDLAVVNYNSQSYLYVNDENNDDYLKVRLVGHRYDQGSGFSNRDGVGGKVFVYSEGYLGNQDYLLSYREIEANGGYMGQASIEAEFGLPNDDAVDVLVIWPGSDGSHIEEYWEGVAKTQAVTLDEGTGTQWDVGVYLASFKAVPDRSGIALSWDVYATEDTEIVGFNLYRSVRAGEGKAIASRDKLNGELITGTSPYTYIDASVVEGRTYRYWLEAIDVGGASETFGPVDCTWNGALPTAYALYQSRPNPAMGTATIAFDLPEDIEVTLAVYDISGRKVSTVVNETLAAGEHEAEVSGLTPGVYVYKLSAGPFTAARKMAVQ
ncbi:MAG: VCBS repeat-containing protein [Candidatus Coatesbacteria bacterium]|nr:MAG: VCBS repeat-containing protein [Candidatus Coatesbacteria bacterium]